MTSGSAQVRDVVRRGVVSVHTVVDNVRSCKPLRSAAVITPDHSPSNSSSSCALSAKRAGDSAGLNE